MQRKLNIVSLFDGISCGRVAIERAGYAVSSYVAFEIDKYARAISRFNYPDIEHYGDVMEADFNKFAGYDMVMGGSPCTFWSIARANREVDKDGIGWKLFMKFVEAVRIIKPRFFFYENVASMPSTIRDFISEEFGCKPIMINSALVSAQQRKRLYWTNITDVTQPNDKGILLRDIIDSGVSYVEKSHCMTARYGGAEIKNSLSRGQRTMIFEPVTLKDESNTLCALFYKENAKSLITRKKHGLIVAEEVGAALRTRSDENGKFKRLEVRGDGKLNALTTVQTDSVVCSPVRVGQIGKGGQGSRIYSVHGKTISLMSNGGGRGAKTGLYKIDLPDGDYTIRKLTPIEAERCQTLPDNYTAFGVDIHGNTVNISNSQRYKTIGNGWTVDVIAHIFRGIGGDF
ncbi:MAG: DNA cytosine methyltransferase [Defluviitaleaceae bacterium]|nr:DNA cytosine methyltransferase [Defluviitaleaceae bacterium]